MFIKIKKITIIYNLLLMLIILCGFTLYLFIGLDIALLIICFLLMLLIILRCKISFFSINAIVTTYPLIAIICQYYFGFSYGLLQITPVSIYITEIALIICIYNFMFSIFIFNTRILDKEKELINYIPFTRKLTCEIFAIMAVILVIIAFPYGFMDFSRRQQALLPGSGWMLLSLISLFFSFPRLKESTLIKICWAITLLWYITHGERVEILGFLVMVALLWLYSTKYNKGAVIKYIIYGTLFILLFAITGNIVRGVSLNVNSITKSFFLQGSMVDMMYVFNIGIDFVKNNGVLYGETLQTYLEKLILFNDGPSNYTLLLRNYYPNPGGGYALLEGYLNLEYFGVVLQTISQILLIWYLLKKNSKYRYYCFFIYFALIFRTTWYGYYYYVKTPIYYIPIFLLLEKVIHMLTTKYKKSNDKIHKTNM